MDQKMIKEMERKGYVHARSKDIPRMRSLISSSKSVASVVLSMPLNEKTSTPIFRELYESIRQLGDALWWSLGYESESHEASMDILAEANLKEAFSRNKLERFRKIRNDSHYRGFMTSVEQTKDIMNFWKRCSKDIINFIENQAVKR